jgi:hypothetical protein
VTFDLLTRMISLVASRAKHDTVCARADDVVARQKESPIRDETQDPVHAPRAGLLG